MLPCYRPSEDGADSGFQFDGTGFAETQPVRGFKPGFFTAGLSFKTFWEEGQLFFASNDETVGLVYKPPITVPILFLCSLIYGFTPVQEA